MTDYKHKSSDIGKTLLEIFVEQGLSKPEAPCGGKGRCGKCLIRCEGALSAPDENEIKLLAGREGYRLACLARCEGDFSYEMADGVRADIQTDFSGEVTDSADTRRLLSVDIGTTTVAMKLFSADGSCVAEAGALNPQRAYSADIMGRIDFALKGGGDTLQTAVKECVFSLLSQCCQKASISVDDIDKMVIAGNTAMLYLLMGLNPASIAEYPFRSETLFGYTTYLWGIETLLFPCMNAFVGGDITAAVLSAGMCEKEKNALLCDIGTNGEIALWKDGMLYVTSTSAGPAFEGAEISCGCGAVDGAVYRVWAEEGEIFAHTIGNKPACGICGSGLIDSVAAFLENGRIDQTGAIKAPLVVTANGGSISLTQNDIRAFRLAKAAIAAGIQVLLNRSKTETERVSELFLAGGFGTRLDTASSEKTGLLPSVLAKRSVSIGNAALAGATCVLFDQSLVLRAEEIAKNAVHIPLGGNEDINTAFIHNINFS